MEVAGALQPEVPLGRVSSPLPMCAGWSPLDGHFLEKKGGQRVLTGAGLGGRRGFLGERVLPRGAGHLPASPACHVKKPDWKPARRLGGPGRPGSEVPPELPGWCSFPLSGLARPGLGNTGCHHTAPLGHGTSLGGWPESFTNQPPQPGARQGAARPGD